MYYLCKRQHWPLLPCPDTVLGESLLGVPWLSSLPGCGSPHSSAELGGEVSCLECLLGSCWGTPQLCPLVLGGKQAESAHFHILSLHQQSLLDQTLVRQALLNPLPH